MNAKGAIITVIATILGFAASEGSKKILTAKFNPEEEEEREEVMKTLIGAITGKEEEE